jgi:hypothetical protein
MSEVEGSSRRSDRLQESNARKNAQRSVVEAMDDLWGRERLSMDRRSPLYTVVQEMGDS